MQVLESPPPCAARPRGRLDGETASSPASEEPAEAKSLKQLRAFVVLPAAWVFFGLAFCCEVLDVRFRKGEKDFEAFKFEAVVLGCSAQGVFGPHQRGMLVSNKEYKMKNNKFSCAIT